MRPRLVQLLTSFSSDDPGSCKPNRPAIVTRARCPGVGPEVQTKILEGNEICAPQPPACCESAKRAEHAAKMIDTMIQRNPLLKLFTMSSSPWFLASAPTPPLR